LSSAPPPRPQRVVPAWAFMVAVLVGLALAVALAIELESPRSVVLGQAPVDTGVPFPPPTVDQSGDCFAQPNQFAGAAVVLEVKGVRAASYCAGLGSAWHTATKPNIVTTACDLTRGDVGEAIVWDTGLHVDGNQVCDRLRQLGWQG
jgi:hypothetical protein